MENISIVIAACKHRNHNYQRILYEQYRGYAFKIVFRYIYEYDDAANAVNDGFVKLLNNIDKFEAKADVDEEKLFMAWLKTIMIHIAIDHLRKESRTIETIPISQTVWELQEPTGNAGEILFYNDLISLIKQLPAPYRMVFNLYVIDGYSHAEIAGIMQIPVATSRSNLLRARAILQKKIIHAEEKETCRI